MTGHETFCAAPLSPPCNLFASANGFAVVCAAPCHGGLGGGVGRGWLPTVDLLLLLPPKSQALLSRGCVVAPPLAGEGRAAGWKVADAEFQCAG